ncbi:MAG: hypothetical protein E7633_02890 [Ruminococcaceae bacterium]|nr:hypothetical protein [Oscillospiraceae bacterium]
MLFLLVIGALLIIFGSFFSKKSAKYDSEYTGSFSYSEYETEIEERIAKIVSEIGGISDVSVMVTLESTVSYSYAENSKDKNSEYVTIRDKDGNESGVLLSENAPGIRGVAVVCNGGDIPEKKLEIIKMVSALLGLPQNRVYVGGRF